MGVSRNLSIKPGICTSTSRPTSPYVGQVIFETDTLFLAAWNGSSWSSYINNGTLTTQGDILYASGVSTPARLGIGTAGHVLKVNAGATAPQWGQVASAGIADDAVTNSKLGLTEVKVRRVANQSIPNSSATYISWDTEDADLSGFITATSDTLTVPSGAAGLYIIGADINWASNLYGVNEASIWAHDAEIGRTVAPKWYGTQPNQTVTCATWLAVGETVRIMVGHSNGSATNLTARLTMTRLVD